MDSGPHIDFGQSLDSRKTLSHMEAVRMVEALLFAASEPQSIKQLAERLPPSVEIQRCLETLQGDYKLRGVNLLEIAGKWALRTAPDLAHLMQMQHEVKRNLSRAAREMLAIIAYHQPITRAEIEDVRGVSTSRGSLDVLMEIGWVEMCGRAETPGRPMRYGTTDQFLNYFSLRTLEDLPGLDELKGAGLLHHYNPQSDLANAALQNPNELSPPADDDDEADRPALSED